MAAFERTHPQLKPGEMVQAIRDQVLPHRSLESIKSRRNKSQVYRRVLLELGSPPRPPPPSPPRGNGATRRRPRLRGEEERQLAVDDPIPEVEEVPAPEHPRNRTSEGEEEAALEEERVVLDALEASVLAYSEALEIPVPTEVAHIQAQLEGFYVFNGERDDGAGARAELLIVY